MIIFPSGFISLTDAPECQKPGCYIIRVFAYKYSTLKGFRKDEGKWETSSLISKSSQINLKINFS